MSQLRPDDRERPHETVHTTSSSGDSSRDAEALDQVVRTMVESLEADEQATAEEIAALGAVATRLGNLPLTLDPVVIALVEAMITVNYGHLKRAPEIWTGTAHKIATLLFDSPAARARLDNLWRSLLERYGTAAHA